MIVLAVFLLSLQTAGCSQTVNSDAQAASQNASVQEDIQENDLLEDAGSDVSSQIFEDVSEDTSSEVSSEGISSEKTAAEAGTSEKSSEAASFQEASLADSSEAAASSDQPSESASSEGLTSREGSTEASSSARTSEEYSAQEGETASEDDSENVGEHGVSINGESDIEYNARQILFADESITKEGALGVAAYLWQMGFGKLSGYPTITEKDGLKVLTVFDENGLFYNVFMTPEGKIQQIEDVSGNELITLGPKAGELLVPPLSGADVIALLEDWKSKGGHSQVLSAYNKYAGDYGRSKMDSDDQWCSETVSAAYAFLGLADKIGGMASNGNTYEKNARAIGAWESSSRYIPSEGDILITHDGNGDRHTSCVRKCDGHTIYTIAGGGSSIHHGSVSVGSDRITGFVVPQW